MAISWKIAAIPLLVLLVLFCAGAGCTGTQAPGPATTTAMQTPTPTTAPPTVTPDEYQNKPVVNITLVAKDLKFDKTTITVPAGSVANVTFDNQDSGVRHNFALYTDSTAKTVIFASYPETGPRKKTFTFLVPPKGTYYFRCDIHQASMNGQFIVQ